MKSIYGLLDYDARRWWYHAKLRRDGNIEEARKRERQSIRGSVNSLRRALVCGGHLSIGRGGWTLHTGRHCSLQGVYFDSPLIEAARLLGIPIIDTRTVPDDLIWQTVRLPMVAVDTDPDPEPWRALSYAPLSYVARKCAELGATVYNLEV